MKTGIQMLGSALDAGELDIDEYLDRTIFYRPRQFRQPAGARFHLYAVGALPGFAGAHGAARAGGKVFLATLNNESRELNLYRIEKFGLRNYFSVFFSSCYLRICKPHPQIYQMALDLSQRQPQECVFIDDRPLNLECARHLACTQFSF